MAALKISKRTVDAASVPPKSDAYFWDTDLKGFGLRVTPKGVRSYVVQFRLKGRPARRMTLGVHGSPWTADKARSYAETILIGVKQGVDPVEAERRKAREARDLGFGAYIDRFVDGYLKDAWSDSWQNGKRQLEMHVAPHLKGRALPDIRPDELTTVFDALRSQKGLARNTFAVLRLLFRWAVERHDIARSPMDGMRAPPKPKDRKRVLTPDELVALWRASFKLTDPQGPYVRSLMLTLQRRNEVARLPWAELDKENALWHMAGDRAKNEEPHLVPLSTLSVNEFAALGWKRRGFVFSSDGKRALGGFSKLKARLDEYMLPILQELADEKARALGEDPRPVEVERWTLHDIRRSGTTALQALGFPVEVTEKVINHKSGEVSGVAKVYNLWAYEPEKRSALNAWAGYLEKLVTGATASNVIALAERRA